MLMGEILQGNLTGVQIASLLTGLRMKGETEEEIIGFIKAMRRRMVKMPIGAGAIDVCGTGGDGKGTFNISTATAFVVTGAGVAVAKHGNRAASSKSGSADVLEAMGVNIMLTAAQVMRCLKEVGITFLFAPLYHPAMKHVSLVRRELGIRTIFNFLGPLVNPAGVKRQIIGVPNLEIAEKLSRVAARLRYEHLLILTSEDGLDEVSVLAKTHVFEVKGKKAKKYILDPKKYGFKYEKNNFIHGGDAKENAAIIKSILDGERGLPAGRQGGRRDIVIFNSALALYVSGKAKTIDEGILMAKKSIDSGRAKKVLETFISFSQNRNKFRNAILHPKNSNTSLIAEIKLKSPTEGKLGEKRDVKGKVIAYEKGEADCLSVVVDKKRFGGSYELLSFVRNLTTLPILCKDFVVSKDQIYKAKKNGADAVLLIAKILSLDKLVQLVKLVEALGMEPVVEVNTEEELIGALKTGVEIVAVNSRNLDDFSIDRKKACEILGKIPKTHTALAFSGVKEARDIERYKKAGAKGVLVGTILMKSDDPAKLIKKLKSLERVGPFRVRPLNTMKTKIKICGIKTVEEAQMCIEAGVDFIGLNFVPSSKRRISEDMAKRIILSFSGKIQFVGVFQDQNKAYINHVVQNLHLDFVQLHGEESPYYCDEIDCQVIKTISARKTDSYSVAYFLVDREEQGKGKMVSLEYAKNMARQYPIFLAGGLNPENVGGIVAGVAPFAVDVAGGVETNGKKDSEKIIAFVKNARGVL